MLKAHSGSLQAVDDQLRQVPQILLDKITIDQIHIGVDELLCHRPRYAASAYHLAVEGVYWAKTEAGGGDKSFVRRIGLIRAKILFDTFEL